MRQPVVATTRTRLHPFMPPSPNRRKDPEPDMPENRTSDLARSSMPKNRPLKKLKKPLDPL
jgi:hypothetical protein